MSKQRLDEQVDVKTGMEMTNICKTFRYAMKALLASGCLAQPLSAAPTDSAKDYPNKPIRFIVNSVAGGGSDTTARAIAQKLSETWGHQLIVDNRPGASGAIAVEFTTKAVPDGYTICLIASSQIINPAVNPKISHDFTKDLAPVTLASSLFYVLYHSPKLPVKSTKDLIAYAKANPGKLNYGSAGNASMQHLAWEMFGYMTGTKLVHVPYKGGVAAVSALLAGDVQVGFAGLVAVRPHMPSGRLRLLAITARQRSSAAPDLPTVAEAGVPDYEVTQWYGVVTGAKVSPAILRKLNAGMVQALKSPDVVQRLASDGSTAAPTSAEEFGAYIKSETTKWRKLVKDARLVLN